MWAVAGFRKQHPQFITIPKDQPIIFLFLYFLFLGRAKTQEAKEEKNCILNTFDYLPIDQKRAKSSVTPKTVLASNQHAPANLQKTVCQRDSQFSSTGSGHLTTEP